MRINRALEKLRKFFNGRGVFSTGTIIAGAISAHSVRPAPATLAAAVVDVAAKGCAATASTSHIIRGTIMQMAWAKLRAAIVASAAVVLLATGTITLVTRAGDPAASIKLPPEVRQQLDKQKAALRQVYFEVTETSRGTLPGYGYRPDSWSFCFDGSRFYQHRRSTGIDRSFDGENVWERDAVAAHKWSVAAARDRTRWHSWDWPYLEAALYAPRWLDELDHFGALEPLVLHYLTNSKSGEVGAVGEDLRLTFQVQDAYIAHAKKVDLDEYRAHLEGTPNTPEWIAEEIETVKRLQAMKPTRTVILLLDSKHGYGVAEHEERNAAGERILHARCDDWKFYEKPGIWLPNRCVTSHFADPRKPYDVSRQPVYTLTHELKLVEFERKNVPFSLDRPPGAAPRATGRGRQLLTQVLTCASPTPSAD
jgi:hypothetical protein